MYIYIERERERETETDKDIHWPPVIPFQHMFRVRGLYIASGMGTQVPEAAS